MWYCKTCDKPISKKTKSKHNKSKYHKHIKKLSVVVKDCDFIRPDSNEIHFITDKCARDCYNRFFHKFKLKCIYVIGMTNGDFVIAIISDKTLKKMFERMFLS